MPPLVRADPITSLRQLKTELAYLRQCHADETTAFISRIDPAIFTSQDRETLMQPMILGIVQKKLKTDVLSSILGVSCPIVNREADDAVLGLLKSWLADKSERTELMFNDRKNTIHQAYAELEQHPSHPVSNRSRYWTVRETSILHALYPILGHDHDAYTSILTERTALQISHKIQSEYTRGYLGDHKGHDHYKQTKAIHYKPFRDIAGHMGLLKDRHHHRRASQANELDQTHVPSIIDGSGHDNSILTELSSSIALTRPRRMGRSKKLEEVEAQVEKFVSTESSRPRRRGRLSKSDDAQTANSTAPRRRIGRPRKSKLADTHEGGIETVPRQVGRRNKHFDAPEEQHTQSIETTSPSPGDTASKFENDESKHEQSSELTSPRRSEPFKRVDSGKIKKVETLPISSHSAKAGEKPSKASSTPASSSKSPPHSSCLAS
ncbi:hypothetical protein INT44_000986 [Umbelopsis vinacea]|uniref:Uncharacterized protein n=1 Tax=Umbelopsis vinacea TaxID=44442 RepID=A0A8H7Q871_9FUNG|nr:hypothetical protein INT44_000986 [Umbelopsis vinacea]